MWKEGYIERLEILKIDRNNSANDITIYSAIASSFTTLSNSFLHKLNELQSLNKVRRIVDPNTIQNWREGYVIGPRELMNIKLIGKIYNFSYLEENYLEIGAAIRRLRGIHQKLLRNFNDMILRAGVKNIKGAPDEMIDEEFNLHLEDFVGSVTIEKIKTIYVDETAERFELDKIKR